MFESIANVNWGDLLKGAGSLAGAWSTYKTGNEANKLTRENINYQKELNTKAEQKNDLAQSNLDSAIEDVYGSDKKKKKTTDVSLAYGTPSTEV